MKRTKNKIIGWMATALLLGTSCARESRFDTYEHLPDEGWKRSDIKNFSPVISDTLCAYQMEISVRHDNRYPFKNLWLLVSYPNIGDSVVTDTLNVLLSNERGEWLGSGLTTNEVQLTLDKPVFFKHSGPKTLSLEQASSKEAVKGITDIGIRLNKMPGIALPEQPETEAGRSQQ